MINFLWDYLEGVPGAVTLNCNALLRFLNCLVGIFILLWHFCQGSPPTWEGGPVKATKVWWGFFGVLRQSGWISLHTHTYTHTNKIVPTLYPNTCSWRWCVRACTSAGPPSHHRSDVSLFLSLAHQTQATGPSRRKSQNGSALILFKINCRLTKSNKGAFKKRSNR